MGRNVDQGHHSFLQSWGGLIADDNEAYIECNYYYQLIGEFDGCPGLDVGADDEMCEACPYCLDKIKFALEAVTKGEG